MNQNEFKVKVGQRVRISRPGSGSRFAPSVERFGTVTAVRPKSFDAGGLCFRNDGREWNGHNRVHLIPQEAPIHDSDLTFHNHETVRLERAERTREDVILAFLLSAQQEQQWLKLGLQELLRIAALHGLTAPVAEFRDEAERTVHP